MEAWEAVGTVANVVALVDFGWKLVSASAEIARTGGSALVGGRALEAATTDLRVLSGKVRDSLGSAAAAPPKVADADANSSDDDDDSAILDLCRSSEEVAGELLAALDKISAKGDRRAWTSVRKALRTIWSKDDIEELEKRLASIRDQLNLRVVTDIRKKILKHQSDLSSQVHKLDDKHQKLLDAIMQQADLFKQGVTAHTEMKHTLERQEQYAATAEQESLLDKLPHVPEAAFNSLERQHSSNCLENTRVDVLRRIEDWVMGDGDEGGRPVFWLSGWAGTGKSTIASTVAAWHGHLTASYFFSRGGGEAGRARRLFTTLARQMADRSPALRKVVCDAVAKNPRIAELSIADQWRHLILGPLLQLGDDLAGLSLLIVLDALDECDDEKDVRMIIRVLDEAREAKTIHLRILLTSRPEMPIQAGFSSLDHNAHQNFVLHDVSRSNVDHDIELFLEDGFKKIANERDLGEGWPGRHQILQLVHKSGGLFIWAATAYRFVDDGKSLAVKRLAKLLNEAGQVSRNSPEQKLDNIYTMVLNSCARDDYDDDEKEEIYATLRDLLGCLVALKTPLPAADLASVLDLPLVDVEQNLKQLSSIIDTPRHTPVRLHHPSFRDFLLSKGRSTDKAFHVDEAKAHRLLTERCIRLMSQSLKQNMCDLQPLSATNDQVTPEQINGAFSVALKYACENWTLHVVQSDLIPDDNGIVYCFLKDHILHWLESMSLLRLLNEGFHAIFRLRDWLKASDPASNSCPGLRAFVDDAAVFGQSNTYCIKSYPLHVYYSALIFAPESSPIRSRFAGLLTGLRVSPVDHRWYEKNTVELSSAFSAVLSPDGKSAATRHQQHILITDTRSGANLSTILLQRPEMDSRVKLDVALSTNGLLAAVCFGAVKIWDSTSGFILAICQGHTDVTASIAFSPDGRLLALGGGERQPTIMLFDISDCNAAKALETPPRQLHRTPFKILNGHQDFVGWLTFSSDGFLASASVDGTVRLWNLEEARCLHTFSNGRKVSSHSSLDRLPVALSTINGLRVAYTGEDGALLWTSKGTAFNDDGHSRQLTTVRSTSNIRFSPDGTQVALVGSDSMEFFDAASGERTREIDIFNAFDLVWSHEGKIVFLEKILGTFHVGQRDHIYQRDICASKEENTRKSGCERTIWLRLVAPNTAISRRHEFREGGKSYLILWEESGLISTVLTEVSHHCTTSALSPTRRRIAFRGTNGSVLVLHIGQKRVLHSFQPSETASMLALSDGGLVAVISKDREIAVWDCTVADAPRLKCLLRQEIFPWFGSPISEFSPDDRYLIVAGSVHHEMYLIVAGSVHHEMILTPDRMFRTMFMVWDMATEKEVTFKHSHSGTPENISYSPDGQSVTITCKYTNTKHYTTWTLSFVDQTWTQDGLGSKPEFESGPLRTQLEWIVRGEHERLLCLPLRYWDSHFSSSTNECVLTNKDGSVTFIQFSDEPLDEQMG